MNVNCVSNPSNAAQATTSVRLHKAAVQFEAMLLQELVKPMSSTFSGGEEDGVGNPSQSGPMQSFATEAVASSLAGSGALGFARQVERTLSSASQKNVVPQLKS